MANEAIDARIICPYYIRRSGDKVVMCEGQVCMFEYILKGE